MPPPSSSPPLLSFPPPSRCFPVPLPPSCRFVGPLPSPSAGSSSWLGTAAVPRILGGSPSHPTSRGSWQWWGWVSVVVVEHLLIITKNNNNNLPMAQETTLTSSLERFPPWLSCPLPPPSSLVSLSLCLRLRPPRPRSCSRQSSRPVVIFVRCCGCSSCSRGSYYHQATPRAGARGGGGVGWGAGHRRHLKGSLVKKTK